MASYSLLAAFLATTALFACVPGPAMLYAAARTVASGRRSGLMAALGIHIGGYAHIFAAAAGLSTLLIAVPALYVFVKLAGAIYLAGLGIALFLGRSTRGEEPSAAVAPARNALIQSIMVELLNPKTAIFFLAFLPQFADPTGSLPIWLQLAVLGTVVNMIFSVSDVVCVLAADLILARLNRSERIQRWLRRAGGAVLVGLGGHLALQQA